MKSVTQCEGFGMNSKELNVNVPLATVESDSEEIEGFIDQDDESKSSLSPDTGDLGLNSVTGSLEDLVATFDEKLQQCFRDYQEEAEKIAPVQVRTQEEIMNECQVWWTLTGQFGNILPIDWSKTYTREKMLPALNLCSPRPEADLDDDSEDDIVAADLDMHQLITSSDQQKQEPIKSAEEVLQEIDDIIDNDDDDDDVEGGAAGGGGGGEHDQFSHLRGGHHHLGDGSPRQQIDAPHSIRSSTFIGQALAGRRLEDLAVQELSQLLTDVETLVRDLSEELVKDLGSRDELEYEKELKNTFISLLLSIQSKRRHNNIDTGGPKKKKERRDSKYLTTVIPYNAERGCPSLATLQVLVKILKSINEDSPAVPALLTDYILKVLVPK
eukprot:TRINITY_DN2396_c0_g2_i1.p1 TRINITY_DN2396_c0_g2~~TRINITY_DN2396_c0_g2_i1.p1  ORF type:complete len:384 (-),score=130.47 TRINITY_DN2396_c0_g2_i1:442-1593(-)